MHICGYVQQGNTCSLSKFHTMSLLCFVIATALELPSFSMSTLGVNVCEVPDSQGTTYSEHACLMDMLALHFQHAN